MTAKGSEGAARGYSEAELRRLLARLEKHWPKTHWLFAANGLLHLMRIGADGAFAMKPGGGSDPAYSVETFGGIRCDGGDW